MDNFDVNALKTLKSTLDNLDMETQELDLLISENQIAMDFDDDKIIEESHSLPKAILSPKNHDYIGEEVLFVVAKVYNESLVHDFPNLKICGKSMVDWVLLAGETNCS